MRPTENLKRFDAHLALKDLTFNAIVIGGAALAILGTITRETQDCDVLAPKIPDENLSAAKDFSHEIHAQGGNLKEDWLNNGPESLRNILPEGWEDRTQGLFSGKALHRQTLARPDLLCSKFFAYCDRQQDLSDCIALKPTKLEILGALAWLRRQDAHPGWPDHVNWQMAAVAQRLGYEL